jgi:YidC/Oxa1 family membrane protein insertase
VDQLFKFIAWILSEAYAVFHSYGLSIVLLTLIVMAITTPLTIKGTKSMIQMQRLQPELKKIQERHRDDRETMNQELLAFYKANNINPVGGCLPMFIQLPVFAVLYRVVHGLTQRVSTLGIQTGTTTANLRDAAGLVDANPPKQNFKPGYISSDTELYKSLSQVKEMKSWGIDLADSASSALSRSLGHALPYLLLIAIVAVTGVVQQRQIQGRSNASSQVNSQQQAIMKIMPFFLPVISFGLPAGLVIYFVVSNLWRVGQQAFITRTLYAHAALPAVVETTASEVEPVPAAKPKAPRAVASAAASDTPAKSVLGRNRREGATPTPPRVRAATSSKPVTAPPPASGRATPAGSSASARPAKSKKKRK